MHANWGGGARAEFRTIRNANEINDAELSRQLTRLSDVGYVEITKTRSGRYAKTWLAITPSGRNALKSHVAALKAITG